MLECRIRYICLFIFYSWLDLEGISRLLQSCTLYSSTFCSYLLFRHLKSCWHNDWRYFLRHNVIGRLNTNNFLFLFFYFSDFILIFFSLFFYFYFGRWRGMWHHSHMTGHMMWCYRPKTWWKDLEDDVRAHVYNMVALSRK